jgi:FAD/FMN-containing dehydrogenase
MSRSVAEFRNLEFTIVFGSAPPHLAGEANKVATAIANVFADTEAEARSVLAQVARTAPAGALEIQENMPTPFEVLYAIIAQFFPEGARYAVDSFWGAPEGMFERLAMETAKAPAHRSFSLGVVLPPRAGTLPDAAFSMIAPAFACTYAIWDDAADDEANIGWLRSTAHKLAPLTRGAYVGEADLDRPMHIRRCFSAEAWNQLKALQAKYDPAGLFRTQQSLAVPRDAAA